MLLQKIKNLLRKFCIFLYLLKIKTRFKYKIELKYYVSIIFLNTKIY